MLIANRIATVPKTIAGQKLGFVRNFLGFFGSLHCLKKVFIWKTVRRCQQVSVGNGIGKEDVKCLRYGQWGAAVLIDYVTGLAFIKDGC